MSSEASPPARRGRETALAALFFLATTVVLTWPQAVRLGDGMSDVWDAKLNARILQWDFEQTLHDPARLFQLNFFFPARDVLAFSENLWGASLFGFPLLAAGASPLLNYNALLLAGMFLSALGAWALARRVTGDPAASLVAGLVFAFLPWRFSQLTHVQFQWAGFLCLLLLFLLRYLDHGRPADAVLFSAAFAWNALCNVHYALFGGVLVLVTLGVSAFQGRGTPHRRALAVVAAAAGGLAFLPFALAYRDAHALYGMKRYLSEILTFSGRWSDFLSAGDRNRLYGPLTKAWRGAEGDFFPGLVPVLLAGVAIGRLVRLRPSVARGPGGVRAPIAGVRRWVVPALDAVAAVLLVLFVWAHLRPGLELGALRLREPGRILVWLSLVVLVRLTLAFPARARSRDLGDFVRRLPVARDALLLVVVLVLGVVLALGARTPYYRFLFQTFGGVLGAIRAPARAIVLFHLGLAVLAAWGLAVLIRGRSGGARLAGCALAVALIVLEYRAFPLELTAVRAEAPPVYGWLASASLPGAVVEWPFGLLYDFDYVFRQAQHGRPILNGYSGFFPATYTGLEAALRQRPIPDSVWARMGELGAGILVYHSHDGRGVKVTAYADALDGVLASGAVELVRSFPHDGGTDFVVAAAGTPGLGRLRGSESPEELRRLYAKSVARLRTDVNRLAPPFGNLHLPSEGQAVRPGFWAHGWALDDSWIARVEVATDAGPAGEAMLGGPWPGLAQAFPDYEEARSTGSFGFAVPALPAGPHRIVLTLVGRDGGTSRLEVTVRILAPPLASPTPRGPGS